MHLPALSTTSATDAALREQWAQTNDALRGVHDLLCEVRDKLDEIARLQRRKDPLRFSIVIGGGGTPPIGIAYKVASQGYRHSRLWLPASATVNVDLGMGAAALALVAGWNVLDASDGATLASNTSTTINAVLELTDDPVQ